MLSNKQKAAIEAGKEIGRWLVLMSISWFISETLKQADLLPTTYSVQFGVFYYSIPLRFLFQSFLTLAGRYVDKFIHEYEDIDLKGLVPF